MHYSFPCETSFTVKLDILTLLRQISNKEINPFSLCAQGKKNLIIYRKISFPLSIVKFPFFLWIWDSFSKESKTNEKN